MLTTGFCCRRDASSNRVFCTQQSFYSDVKSGAASFYIVAVSTLILVILATSFATAILAAITRSANDELAQSAYDSAMAGVEEAKLAYTNYHNCVTLMPSLLTDGSANSLDTSSNDITCQDIVYWVQHPQGDKDGGADYNGCDMVAHILGRIGKYDSGEVKLDQTPSGSAGNNNNATTSDLDQAYTCVKIYVNSNSISGSLSPIYPYKIVKIGGETNEGGNVSHASSIDTVTLRWGLSDSNTSNSRTYLGNLANLSSQPLFVPRSVINQDNNSTTVNIPVPAVVSFQLIQTPINGFSLEELNSPTISNTTNRATMYFVPTNNPESAAIGTASDYYVGIYDKKDGQNYLSASQVASNNDITKKHYPYLVYCDDKDSDFSCSVTMELPEPISGGKHADNTLAFIASLPYGGPDTIYKIDFTCNDGSSCSFKNQYSVASSGGVINQDQFTIDSTGRAGDMYKRIEAVLETESSSTINGYPFYAIQATTISKNIQTNTEWGVAVPEETEPEEPVIAASCEDVPVMQNWNGADTLAMEETTYLCDKRDGKVYSVAKLKDGKVWMTTNLDLAGGTVISAIDTDMDDGYILPTEDGFLPGNRLPESSSNPFGIKCTGCVNAILYNSNNPDCSSGSALCYSYYTFTTSTLGSGSNTLSTATDLANAPYSICPKGWRLPTIGINYYDDDDYYKLVNSYGIHFGHGNSNIYNLAFFVNAGPGTVPNFLLSGCAITNNDGLYRSCQNIGDYLSATHSNDYAYGFAFKQSGQLWKFSTRIRGYLGYSEEGIAVRCIKR